MRLQKLAHGHAREDFVGQSKIRTSKVCGMHRGCQQFLSRLGKPRLACWRFLMNRACSILLMSLLFFLLALPPSVLPGKQEIYFASRWKLVIGLITGAQGTYSLTESCSCSAFAAKISSASELLRQFQCVDSSDSSCGQDQCLAATESGFEFQTCDTSLPAQLLDGNQAGLQTFKPIANGSRLAGSLEHV